MQEMLPSFLFSFLSHSLPLPSFLSPLPFISPFCLFLYFFPSSPSLPFLSLSFSYLYQVQSFTMLTPGKMFHLVTLPNSFLIYPLVIFLRYNFIVWFRLILSFRSSWHATQVLGSQTAQTHLHKESVSTLQLVLVFLCFYFILFYWNCVLCSSHCI